jgi:hypothetical protein
MLDSGSGSEDVTYITPKTSPNQDQFLPPSASNPILLTAHDELGAESSDDDVPADILEAASAHPTTTRFFGRSSTTGIIRQAVETKSTLMGRSLNHDPRQPEDWISSVSLAFSILWTSRLTILSVGERRTMEQTHASRVHLPSTGSTPHSHKRLLCRNQHSLATSSSPDIRRVHCRGSILCRR